MSIEKFYTTTIAITRLTWANDSGTEASEGSITGHIQQAGAETAEYLGEALGQAFLVWCAKDEDVEVGDTLTISTGDYAGTYTVKNAQINALGGNAHLELAVVKAKV